MLNNLDQLVAEAIPDEADAEMVITVGGNSVPYPHFVGTLAKEMGDITMNMLHAAVGISGEAGELLDAIKKLWVYNADYTPEVMDNIIEELGDLEFYMQHMRLVVGLSRQEVLDANAKKLGKRYANGYSDAAAQVRADKVEPQTAMLHVIDMSQQSTQGDIKSADIPVATAPVDSQEQSQPSASAGPLEPPAESAL